MQMGEINAAIFFNCRTDGTLWGPYNNNNDTTTTTNNNDNNTMKEKNDLGWLCLKPAETRSMLSRAAGI